MYVNNFLRRSWSSWPRSTLCRSIVTAVPGANVICEATAAAMSDESLAEDSAMAFTRIGTACDEMFVIVTSAVAIGVLPC